MSEEKVTKVTVESPVEPVITSLVELSAYCGMDADDVTKALMGRSDVNNISGLMITNVIENEKREGAITLVVNKSLPQYLLNADTGAYELSTSRNIFTSRIQLAAILKGQGELQMANIIEKSKFSVVLAVLEGARISILSRLLSSGEQYINPYSSRVPSEARFTEHDRMEYFPYEIMLGDKAGMISRIQIANLLG